MRSSIVAAAFSLAVMAAPAAAGGASAAPPRHSAGTAARRDVTRAYRLERCPGTIHAGFTTAERRRAIHYARYAGISCRRARSIVRLIDHTRGPYPAGYFWETPHGDPSTWPTVFGHLVSGVYLSPDGFQGNSHSPGIAVVTFA